MREFEIVVKQVTNYGTFRDKVKLDLADIKKVLPKKVRDRITSLGTLNEVEKVTLSIEEV